MENTALIGQGLAVLFAAILFLGWVYSRHQKGEVSANTTLRQLLLWYPASAPWLFVRTPLLYVLVDVCGLTLWAAVIVEFIIERPLFFLTARELAHATEKKS